MVVHHSATPSLHHSKPRAPSLHIRVTGGEHGGKPGGFFFAPPPLRSGQRRKTIFPDEKVKRGDCEQKKTHGGDLSPPSLRRSRKLCMFVGKSQRDRPAYDG